MSGPVAAGLGRAVPWDGRNRRGQQRWYVPFGAVHACARGITLRLSDVSLGGIGIIAKNAAALAPGWSGSVHLIEPDLVIAGVVRRVEGFRIGVASPDREVLAELLTYVRQRKAVCLHGVHAKSIAIEGHVGFRAHAEMRLGRRFERIDLSRAESIDGHGVGLLAAHVERGSVMYGCHGPVADLLREWGFCAKYCGKCSRAQRRAS